MSRLCAKIGQCQLELRDVNGALRTFEKQLASSEEKDIESARRARPRPTPIWRTRMRCLMKRWKPWRSRRTLEGSPQYNKRGTRR